MRSLVIRLAERATKLRKRHNLYTPTTIVRLPFNSHQFTFSTLAEERHYESVVTDGKTVSLSLPAIFSSTATFHASWLWVNDPNWVHPTSGQKLRTLGQYPATQIVEAQMIEKKQDDDDDDVKYPPSPPGSFHSRGGVYEQEHSPSTTISPTTRTMLHIVWDSGNESWYDVEWLTRCRYDDDKSTSSLTTKITKELAIGAFANPNSIPIPTLDYEQVLNSEEVLFQALHGIMEHGAVLVQGAPLHDDPEHLEATVATLGRHLSGAGLSHGSLYGDIFHVQSIPNAHNIAYTSVALPPHQDLTYYESKPFLQLLHSVHDESDILGGESVLMDSMAAVEHLRTIAPDIFDILCNIEATFLKQRDGADMVSFKPHIQQSQEEVVAVHWSPPFEGPLQNMMDPEVLVDDYAMAYQAMECLLDNTMDNDATMLPPALEQQLREYAQDYTWEHALQQGDILVFNNQRMLHGRRGFSLKGTNQRHLIGCYTDAMETISRYRLLLRQRGVDVVRNAGNGTRGSALYR